MDKLTLQSLDGVAKNIELIGQLFPNALTEVIRNGKVEHAIDFDVLRQELSGSIVEGRDDRYQFVWPDKRKAILAANAPIDATLRPCREESVGRDGTPGGFDSENLYIEGDNLEVLKVLQNTYLGKVKMIYIDPPYNTGNDFVYEDDFAEDAESYLARSGQYDDMGNRMVTNVDSSGRFHTDWLNMIYPRLKIARNLLTDDGAIFISIDDNESFNLHKICDEIFGITNFMGSFQWHRRQNPDSRNITRVSNDHESILCYAKNITKAALNGVSIDTSKYKNPDNDPRGPWASIDLSGLANAAQRPNLHYDIIDPNTGVHYPPNPQRGWSKSKDTIARMIQENRILFPKNSTGRPREKKFLYELRSNVTGVSTWLDSEVVGFNTNGTREVTDLFGGKWFDFPKPTSLIHFFVKQYSSEQSIILDFFSGSATTAHAVIQLNAEDGGHRKFIMVQIPEICAEGSEAYKAGYANICEIGKERIRRAGKKIKEANPMETAELDIGFRVLKLDSTNMQDVQFTAGEMEQSMLGDLIDNIKPDRTAEDLLFQVMLELAVPLTSTITQETIDGKTVFDVEDGFLLACFDQNVTDETVTAIAKREPKFAVFRDSSMANDSVATNFDQIFETYSPDTERRVL